MPEALQLVAAVAATLVGVAAALGVLWRILRPHVENLIRNTATAAYQLQPNDGKSLADKVDRIEAQVNAVAGERAADRAQLTTIEQGTAFTGRLLDRLDRDVERLAVRLEAHLDRKAPP